MKRPFTINPDPKTRAGRMIRAGQVRVTVRSRVSGKHLTIRFDCCTRIKGQWKVVEFDNATHVFIKEGRFGIANAYPKDGDAYFKTDDRRLIFAVEMAARYLNGVGEIHKDAEVFEENRCGRCGLELTDPVSIERGIGPDCYGKITGSKHEKVDPAA